MNKKVLKFEIDLDFVLIAITAPFRDYRVCFLINRELNFSFVKTEDMELELTQNQETAYFSFYRYFWETTETEFFFISNKGTEGYLIPEMNTTDYLIMIKNFIDDDDLDKIISGINRIPEIISAVKVDPKKIKSRENLLF